jgi:DNA-binding MarR family transcriptional regulator
MEYDTLKLSNQLCFPLYACSREVVKKYKPYLDKIGLTYTQYIAMMVMWERKTVNVKTLGECLHLDSGTLTPLLKKLEAAGLVTRERSEKDERNLVVRITKQGEALKEQAKTVPERMASCINLSMEEVGTLYSLLYKILYADEVCVPVIRLKKVLDE